MERIEIIRGGGSALYGANALTGVINIITKPAKDRREVLSSFIGDEGIHQHTFTMVKSFEKFDLSVTGGWRQTQRKANRDPAFNMGEQNFYSTPVLNTKLDYDISDDEKISFFGGYSIGTGGYAASPGDLSIDRAEDWEQTLLQSHYSNKLSETSDLNVKGSFFSIDQQNFRPYTAGNPEKYHVNGVRYNLEAYVVNKDLTDNTLVFGAAYQHVLTKSIGRVTNLAPGRRHSYNLTGVFLQDEYALSDTFGLVGSVRYDVYDDVDNELTTRGTLMCYVDEKNTLRFSAGKSYRRAAIYNQHYLVTWPGGYFKGTSDLPSQTMINYELEYRNRMIPAHTLKVETFQSKLKDVYFNEFTGPGPQIEVSTTDNEYLIRGVISGIEGSLAEDIFKWYSNVTVYKAVDDTANMRMVDVPRYMFNAGVRFSPCDIVYFSADAHYQDGFEAITDATVTDSVNGIPAGTSVSSFTTVDAKIGYLPAEDIELSISVENLFNNQHFEFPLHQERSRTFYVGLRIYW